MLGNIHLLQFENESIAHPYVVYEINKNQTRVCGITTNKKKAYLPGNIYLVLPEGGLKEKSIVDVANTRIISKTELINSIGKLSYTRVLEIKAGIRFLSALARS